MKPTNKAKEFNLYNNYFWGFLAFFVPVIGAILIYYWANKYPKSVKGMALGIFLLCICFLLLGVFYG